MSARIMRECSDFFVSHQHYHPRTGGKDNFGPEKFEMLKRNQMSFLGTYLPPMSRCTILMSYLLFIFGNRHWPARHALGGFLAARPRPLPRQLAARFADMAVLYTTCVCGA
jgi:hypothetical protein